MSDQPSSDGPGVLVIMGSVRAGRLCPKIAAWAIEIGRACASLRLELVDLADWTLPPGDEPGIPAALGGYAQEHTGAWSRKVAGAAGFVFVTPQYNWGYPAALKNALDHLYGEWAGKPVMIVSYGGHGGGKCAAQLRQVAEALKMRPVTTAPGVVLRREIIGGGPFDPAADLQAHVEDVGRGFRELVAALEPAAPR